jgi:hypothetical protein
MKLLFASLILTIATFHVSAQIKQGTYNYGKPKKKEPYGILQIHQTKAGNYLFYLEVGRGEPGFNSGVLYDKITFNKTSGRYEANTKGCVLQFLPDPKGVAISTVKGDCGFAYGLLATGTYITKNHRNPSSFTTRTGKKVKFTKTDPATIKEDQLH